MHAYLCSLDPELTAALTSVLERRGHMVHACQGGQLESILAAGPSADLVCWGWSSDEPRALGALERLRAQTAGSRPWIIACMTSDRAEAARQVLQAGADDYLLRPWDRDVLELRIMVAERAIGQSLSRQEAQDAAGENQELLKLAAAGTSDGFWYFSCVDRDWTQPHNLVWYSRQFRALLGYEESDPFPEVLGTWIEMLHPEDKAQTFEALRKQIDEGVPYDVDYRLRTKQGELRWFQAKGQSQRENGLVRMAGSIRDVTKNRELDAALRENQTLFRLIAENVHDLIWIVRFPAEGSNPLHPPETWKFEYLSPAIERLLGYSPEEAARLTAVDLLTPDSLKQAAEVVAEEIELEAQQADPHRQRTVTVEHREKSGGTRWFEVTAVFLRDEGRPAGLVGVSRDITERMRQEQQLRESEERYRLLAEHATDMISRHRPDGTYLYASPASCELLGYTPEELLNKTGQESFHPDDYAVLEEARDHLLKTNEVVTVAYRFRRKDYRHVWLETTSRTIRDDQGNVVEIVAVSRDISQRKEAEDNLRGEQRLLQDLLDVQENERCVIQFDIHDGMVQQLTGALMHLEASMHVGDDAGRAQVEYERGLYLVRQSVAEGRRLVGGLRPPVLEEAGIPGAIEFLISEQRSPIPKIEFICPRNLGRFAPPLESAVFRIVQEALSNVRKHSQAPRAQVQIETDERFLRVEVRDRGIGFNQDSIRQGSFGLKGMKERARLLGGSAEIQSPLGEGTCVRVELPLVMTKRNQA